MKLLVDACVAASVVRALRAAGHDVDWVGDWEGHPPDEEILRAAVGGGRTIITLDKDFGELAVRRGFRSARIVRLTGILLHDQGPACAEALTLHFHELARGSLLTVSPNRVRLRAMNSM